MPITDDPKPTNTPSPKHPTIASTVYTVHVRAPVLKQLRDPRRFLEALLRRLLTECSHRCAMTSEDPDEASDAARKEAAEGGMTVAAGSSGALVERGEDVMKQVTNGLVFQRLPGHLRLLLRLRLQVQTRLVACLLRQHRLRPLLLPRVVGWRTSRCSVARRPLRGHLLLLLLLLLLLRLPTTTRSLACLETTCSDSV